MWRFACVNSPDVLEAAAALVAPVLRDCYTFAANALAKLQEQPSTSSNGKQGGAGTSGSSMAAGEAAVPFEVTVA